MKKTTLLILLFSLYTVSSVVAQEEIDYDLRNGVFANFDEDTYEWYTWDGVSPARAEFFVDENPDRSGINTSDSVGYFITSTATWEGVACRARFKPIDFSEKKIFKVKVFPPDSGLNFLFKVEVFDNNSIFHQVEAKTTKIEEWEELSFDFSGATSNIYQRIALFPDFGAANEFEWCFDDIRLVGEEGSNVRISDNNIKSYQLLQNYPNPFNSSTMISYWLPKSSNVKIEIYNISGQIVANLINSKQQEGSYSINWDASSMAAGTYIIKFTADGFTMLKKCLLLK